MKKVFLLFFLIPGLVCAQHLPGAKIHIKKAIGTITLDGILDEADWTNADVAKDYYLNYPVDTALAPMQTEARLTFDDTHLYVSFVAYDDESRDMINSLRRDFDYERNDNVGMCIGPYNDGLNGFFFVLTAKGVQMEGTVSGGGASDDSWNVYWDNKWYSKVVRYKDRWIAEAAIPFKSFRYKSGIDEWNVVFDRQDKKRNHKSAWVRTPIQFGTGNMAYSGKIVWDDPIPPAHTNISFIPFVAGTASGDRESSPTSSSSDLQVGFDAKVAVTPSMNLDLTVNPDFSQVEVDQQVINLTRFEYQFPERRQFFLENSDLFDRAGFPEARIFFSRRIGLARDTLGVLRRVPIAFGARLSGSINKNWRLNVLNMQTKEKLEIGLPAQNYSVATVQRNFWKRSSFAVTYADKESLKVGQGDSTKYFHGSIFRLAGDSTRLRRNVFSRVLSGDLELLSADNKLYGATYVAHSFNPFNNTGNTSAGSYFQYATRRVNAFLGNSLVGEHFNAEAGFVPSYGVYPGQANYFGGAGYKFYPKNSVIVFMGPTINVSQTYLPGNGTLTDKNYSINYALSFLNTATLQAGFNYTYVRLTNNFNPIDPVNYVRFRAGEEYQWQNISLRVQTNTRRLLNLNAQTTYGGFYNGTNWNLSGQVNVRYQPYGNISLRFDYNDLKLKETYGSEKLFLIGPRIDITFTDKIFLTTYVQYNNLMDNMNLNARFQWRYKPASDFFIVYTENYVAETLASKNRALVFKFTYWLNL